MTFWLVSFWCWEETEKLKNLKLKKICRTTFQFLGVRLARHTDKIFSQLQPPPPPQSTVIILFFPQKVVAVHSLQLSFSLGLTLQFTTYYIYKLLLCTTAAKKIERRIFRFTLFSAENYDAICFLYILFYWGKKVARRKKVGFIFFRNDYCAKLETIKILWIQIPHWQR